MLRQRATIKELVQIVNDVENKSMTEMGIRQRCKRKSIEIGDDHKVDVASFLEASTQRLRESIGDEKVTLSDGSPLTFTEAKVKLTLLQCDKYQCQIDELKGRLVSRQDVIQVSEKLVADFRSSLKSWLDHTSAKYPDHAALWQEAHDLAIKAVKNGLSI
jgi:hypothetical protein